MNTARDPAVNYLHLEVDVEGGFLRKVDAPHVNGFASKIDTFKQALQEHQIPSVRVVSEQAFADPGQIPFLRASEDLVSKYWDSVFREKGFIEYLQSDYPDVNTLIFTGASTRMCISSSLAGGLVRGYRCVVASDLLLDIDAEKEEKLSPAWHQEHVEAHAYEKLYWHFNLQKGMTSLAPYSALRNLNNSVCVDSQTLMGLLAEGNSVTFYQRNLSTAEAYHTVCQEMTIDFAREKGARMSFRPEIVYEAKSERPWTAPLLYSPSGEGLTLLRPDATQYRFRGAFGGYELPLAEP